VRRRRTTIAALPSPTNEDTTTMENRSIIRSQTQLGQAANRAARRRALQRTAESR